VARCADSACEQGTRASCHPLSAILPAQCRLVKRLAERLGLHLERGELETSRHELSGDRSAAGRYNPATMEATRNTNDGGPEHTDSLTGRTLSHYRIVEKLGSGGMGIVYKAEDTRLHRFVALKFLTDELSRDREALSRFQREARTVSALNHPGIGTIHDVGEQDGHSFITMEYLEGSTLKESIAGRGALQMERLLMDRIVALAGAPADPLRLRAHQSCLPLGRGPGVVTRRVASVR
jgi:hypothetical protein